MSPAPEAGKAAPVTGVATREPAVPARRSPRPLARRLATRLGSQWLPRAGWSIGRTGRPGLVGIALLVAAALFLVSTHLPIAAEVEALRADPGRVGPRTTPAAGVERPGRPAAGRTLPSRSELPSILAGLFEEARQARLAVDTGRYEVSALKSSGLVRYQVSIPVVGPYPRIRGFLDETLARMPEVALTDLLLERKSIGADTVEAQLRLAIYTAEGAPAGLAGAQVDAAAQRRAAAGDAPPTPERVAEATYATALFAPHAWFVPKPVRRAPPPPPPPPPAPAAPPLPFSFVGSYAPAGDPPVYFLARGDRVIDAHVGDRIDGIYRLESATAGLLVFVYLPLDVRQSLAAGASK